MNKEKLNILILYDSASTHTGTVREYLNSFTQYSWHNIYFAVGTQFNKCKFNLNFFDVVIIHYSVRLCFGTQLSGGISKYYIEPLKAFDGYKVLIIQDEYNNTNNAKKMMQDLGVDLVYTCVPEGYIEKVYPKHEFPNTEFLSVLTGYASHPSYLDEYVKPMSMRDNMIVYRGRMLPLFYGHLGHNKYIIGKKMKEICQLKKIKVDIECDDAERIYGNAWYQFIANSRATLGTESGSNIFDFTGEITQTIAKVLNDNPGLSYERVHELYLKQHDDFIKMNQISPKIFESISLRTALILFEGSYSNIIKPDRHYIPLKKDFSNVEDVLKKLDDIPYLEELTERAYDEIIRSGEYAYERFIAKIDEDLTVRAKNKNRDSAISRVVSKNLVTSVPLAYKPYQRKKGISLLLSFLYPKVTRVIKKVLPQYFLEKLYRLRARIS